MLQKTVVLSICKAKYMALAEVFKEVMYLQSIFKALNGYLNINILLNILVIYKDNLVILNLLNNLYKKASATPFLNPKIYLIIKLNIPNQVI